jgi:DNA-binding transcriptional MerR regulator
MESEKSFYKINEVCSMTGVKPYVLRFWETEFARLSPIISSTGQRLYEFQHIELIKQIKDLLFVRKLTIEKAKFEIDSGSATEVTASENQDEIIDVTVDASEVASSEAGFASEVMTEVAANTETLLATRIRFENLMAQQTPLAQIIPIVAVSQPVETQAADELEIVCEIESRSVDLSAVQFKLRNLLSSIEAIELRHQWL